MRVIPYEEHWAGRWDEFAARCPTATFLHTRRFLGYHGDRFEDASLLVEEEGRGVVGLLPAAVEPADARRVMSHPGVTFGGLLHDGRLRGARTVEALELVAAHYAGRGFRALRYKAVPYIYHLSPACDDLYALFSLGARRYRCDLSCAVDLSARPAPSERRRRGLKKASKAGVEVAEGERHAAALWAVLEENLGRKYGASPVHTLEEIRLIHSLFPEAVSFAVALIGGEVVAGVVLFKGPRVVHVQYVASGEAGYDSSALDPVFEECIARAAAEGARYFDFGTSNEDEGRRLNASLYQFKSEFGGGGVAYESYELRLDGSVSAR
jgi:CelD/BcsL family acetyltransferase involved in cellulose biosynthesis